MYAKKVENPGDEILFGAAGGRPQGRRPRPRPAAPPFHQSAVWPAESVCGLWSVFWLFSLFLSCHVCLVWAWLCYERPEEGRLSSTGQTCSHGTRQKNKEKEVRR